MATRVFRLVDQQKFAVLSGDHNPIHLDPVVARRSVFGAPVVHGMHLLCWALDSLAARLGSPLRISEIRADFPGHTSVNTTVDLHIVPRDETTFRIRLVSRARTVARFRATLGSGGRQVCARTVAGVPPRATPTELSPADLADAGGQTPLLLNSAMAADLFPNLAAALSDVDLAALLASTRVVGMECPGMHSLYTGLQLGLEPTDAPDARLWYRVREYDARVNVVALEFGYPGGAGTVQAFVRPTPQEQQAYASLKSLVPAQEFSRCRPMVVGGSRGLGEVCAKLLAAGGADVRLSYHLGQEDAERVCTQIGDGGGRAASFLWDALRPQPDMGLGDWRPTELYYFATPPIGRGVKGSFRQDVYERFCRFYVTGFVNTLRAARASGSHRLRVYYPSTVYAEQLPADMSEYVVSKLAGEALCRFLSHTEDGLEIFVSRLPRLATDQTVTLFGDRAGDPAPALLAELRRFLHGNARTES